MLTFVFNYLLVLVIPLYTVNIFYTFYFAHLAILWQATEGNKITDHIAIVMCKVKKQILLILLFDITDLERNSREN